MRNLWIILCVSTLIMLSYGCVGTKNHPLRDSRLLDGKEIRVGVVTNRPPLACRDAVGEFAGSEIDLIRTFGKNSGAHIVLTEYEKEDLFIALRRGDIDLAIPAVAEREIADRFLSVCAPHGATGRRLVANATIAPFITELKQIDNDNVRVYTVAGTASADFVRRFFKKADIASLENISQCVAKVINDNGCVLLTDETTALNLLKKYNVPEKTTPKVSETTRNKKASAKPEQNTTQKNKPVIALVLERLTNERLAWATTSSNVELKKVLDNFIKTLKNKKDNPVFEREETPLFKVDEPASTIKHSVFTITPK